METHFLLTQLHFYDFFPIIEVICPGSLKEKKNPADD